MRYCLVLLLGLSALFAVQATALRAVGGRTIKSESNYFSSLGRIQAGTHSEAKVMLLGSSITGRLPDRAQGFEGWANMGCDGGTAVDVLRAMDEDILPAAPMLVIEANTLNRALVQGETEVAQAMRRPWFQAGLEAPPLAAYARPAAFVYSPLLSLKVGDFDAAGISDDLDISSFPQPVAADAPVELTNDEEAMVAELSGIIGRLAARGSSAVVVWLPPARQLSPEAPAWVLEWCRRSGIPYWDLGHEAPAELICLTDGIHMSAPTAVRTVRSLRAGLEGVDDMPPNAN